MDGDRLKKMGPPVAEKPKVKKPRAPPGEQKGNSRQPPIGGKKVLPTIKRRDWRAGTLPEEQKQETFLEQYIKEKHPDGKEEINDATDPDKGYVEVEDNCDEEGIRRGYEELQDEDLSYHVYNEVDDDDDGRENKDKVDGVRPRQTVDLGVYDTVCVRGGKMNFNDKAPDGVLPSSTPPSLDVPVNILRSGDDVTLPRAKKTPRQSRIETIRKTLSCCKCQESTRIPYPESYDRDRPWTKRFKDRTAQILTSWPCARVPWSVWLVIIILLVVVIIVVATIRFGMSR